MNPFHQRALDYIKNTGGEVLRGYFVDDHEPIGNKLLDEMLELGLIKIELNMVSATFQGSEITDKERSVYFFRQVESMCGVARLSIATAIEDAKVITDMELRSEAVITLQETLEELLNMFKGESHVAS